VESFPNAGPDLTLEVIRALDSIIERRERK